MLIRWKILKYFEFETDMIDIGCGLNQKSKNFCRVPYLQIFAPGAALWNFFNLLITSQAACQGKIKHGIFVKFKKPAKLLSSSLLVSPSCAPGTSLFYLVPKHFRALWPKPEQAPSWGLLSKWHRQQTTMSEMYETFSTRTQRHSWEILIFIWQQIMLFYEKGV